MADNAKMYFNIGLIFATIEEHERAVSEGLGIRECDCRTDSDMRCGTCNIKTRVR